MTANATRLSYDSTAGFEETTARFNQRVPFLDPAVSAELVIGGSAVTVVSSGVGRRGASAVVVSRRGSPAHG